MTDWIDFKELRKQLDFAEVLRHYGVELKLTGDQHHGFCPLPNHKGKKNSPSFSANLKRAIWQCFGCGEKGNVLDFAVLMERGDPKNGEDVRRVAGKLQEELLGKTADATDKPERNQEESGPSVSSYEEEGVRFNVSLDFELKGLDASHPYLFSRGFDRKTIEQFGLGYCSRGLLAKRIAIPLHDIRGSLVGYAGRVVDETLISEENPKYRFPGKRNRKGLELEFSKSLLVYNANRIRTPVDDLVVVEGFTSVWWLTQAEVLNVVALMGASCSLWQANIINSLVNPCGRVWIFTDGDAAGDRCAHNIFEHVAKRRFVKRLLFQDVVQPTEIASERLKEFWQERKQ